MRAMATMAAVVDELSMRADEGRGGGCRRNMVGSLPRGMPKVVDYRQTGAQATNEMVTQDRHEVLSRFNRRDGVIPTSCV